MSLSIRLRRRSRLRSKFWASRSRCECCWLSPKVSAPPSLTGGADIQTIQHPTPPNSMPRRKRRTAQQPASLDTLRKSFKSPGSKPLEVFPFLSLPIELRFRIWKEYCPDLHGHPRILDFTTVIKDYQVPARGRPLTVHEPVSVRNGRFLAEKTRSVRCVLAVHAESRSLALQVFPDTLPANVNRGKRRYFVVRFSKERDVIFLDADFKGVSRGVNKPWQNPECRLQEFHQAVENLALFDSSLNDSLRAPRKRPSIAACLRLKRLLVVGKEFPGPFTGMRALNLRPEELKNRYEMYVKKHSWHLGPWMACWPDLQDPAQRVEPVAWIIVKTDESGQCTWSFYRFYISGVIKERQIGVWPLFLVCET